MVASSRSSFTDSADELAAIISRIVDLMELVTTNPDDTIDASEVTDRLRRIGKYEEAEEFEMLSARAEELRATSSSSS